MSEQDEKLDLIVPPSAFATSIWQSKKDRQIKQVILSIGESEMDHIGSIKFFV